MSKILRTILKLSYLPVLLILGTSHAFCSSEEAILTILHTNDTYGRLLPFSVDNVEFGGVLRRAYVIRQVRAESPENVIVVDAGDAIGPHPLAAFDRGKTVIQMMNEMGYTAMSLGNHEFGYGVEILRERIGEAQFAMLSANALVKDTGKPLSRGYVRTEVAGVKVGIIGLTTPTARYRAAPHLQKPITFSDPFAAAKDAVKDLKAQGCDFIIVLSHLGYQSDMELSAQVEGINLIVGGEIRSYDERLITVMSPVNYANGATLVYCPWFGGYIGRVDVRLKKQADDGYVVEDIDVKKYRLDDKVYPDELVFPSVPDLKSKLEFLAANYSNIYRGILGQVAENEEISSLELVPLVVRKRTRAEIALLNRGSLKLEVFKGDIERIQAIETVLYPNEIIVLELSGAQLKDALAHSSRQVNENRKLISSGIEKDGAEINGRPINPNEYYTVATNDFLANGGDRYDMIASGRRKRNTGLILESLLIDYIQSCQSSGQAVSLGPLKASMPRFVVKTKTDLGLLLEGLTVSQTAKEYPQINLLQSKNVGNFFYWNVQGSFSTLFASPEYYTEVGLTSNYGRLQHPRLESIELDDNIQGAVIFKLMPGKWKLDPIARLEVENIEFTPSEDNHVIIQLSAGAERKIYSSITVSGGVLLRRHRPEKVTQKQVTLDLRAKYQAKIKGVSFESELKFFPIFVDSASDDTLFENYITSFVNNVKFPLNRYLLLFANAVFYRETQVGPWAHKAEIAMKIVQTFGKKP